MKTTRLCPECGTEFTRVHTAAKPPKFCSQACRNKGRYVPPEVNARKARHGADNHNFKGGHYTWGTRGQKYRLVWLAPEERVWPTVNARGYIHRSHLVWNLANPADPVRPGDIIHHINQDALDDRIENLARMNQREHARAHGREIAPTRRRDTRGRFIQ